MATAPIITIAWQQPTKWVGVEEHVRRGRIRNRGELTAGMIVHVMYKKGWYKAKVINPDPLRTRNRTKKSCTCCASPTKHTHSARGKDRKKLNKGSISNSESDVTVQAAADSANTETDSTFRTEGDINPCEDDKLGPEPEQFVDSRIVDSVPGSNNLIQKINVSDDLKALYSISDEMPEAVATTKENRPMHANKNTGDEGKTVSVVVEMESRSEAYEEQDVKKDDLLETIETHNEVNHEEGDYNNKIYQNVEKADKLMEKLDPNKDQNAKEPKQITEEPPNQITDYEQNAEEPDQNAKVKDQIAEEPDQITELDQTDANMDQFAVEPDQNTAVADQNVKEPGQNSKELDPNVEEPNQFITEPDMIAQGLDPITQEPDEIAQYPDEIAQYPDEIAQDPDKMAQDPDKMAQGSDEIAQDPDEIAQDPDEIAQDPDEIAQDPDKTEQEPNQIAQETDKLAQPDKIVQEPDQITQETNQNAQEPDQISIESYQDAKLHKIARQLDHIAEVSNQTEVEQTTNDKTTGEQIEDEQISKDQTTNKTIAYTSEQIAKEHMYSQPLPTEETSKQVEIVTKQSQVTVDNVKVQNFDIGSDHNENATNQVCLLQVSREAETSQQTESKTSDNSDAASVESEATNAISDVIFVRPSDIQMSGYEPQPNNEEMEQNQICEADSDGAEMECEPTEKNSHMENSQMTIETLEVAQSSINSVDQLEMAHPDEPLGQIRISEPISLAGNDRSQPPVEQPLEQSTGSHMQHQLHPTTQEKQSPTATHQSQLQRSKSQGFGVQSEINHHSKGIVAHQTTLPSGCPGPIILTMKTKKPKHKKSKKTKKHKDKDKERESNKQVPTQSECVISARPPPSAVRPQEKSENLQTIEGHQQTVAQHSQAVTQQPQAVTQQLLAVTQQPQAVKQHSRAVTQNSQTTARHSQAVAHHTQAITQHSLTVPRHLQAVVHHTQAVTQHSQTTPRHSQAHTQAVVRQSPSGIQSPTNNCGVMRSPNVTVSADGSMRQTVEPIRHIEPPRAHMAPQRGSAPGSRTHSQSSQPSPTSPSNPHQWYPLNMPHHPRMPGPPVHHAHMAPPDFATMRARHPQYQSGLPPYVEASFAGAPQHIRSGNQLHLSNVPSPAEAAYIRAQSLARHFCHPHWPPNVPPPPPPFIRDPHMTGAPVLRDQHMTGAPVIRDLHMAGAPALRDPHMTGAPVLRVPRYGHQSYARMPGPGDIIRGVGRPPPLIPAPGPQPRSIHPVSIHKTHPDGENQQTSVDMGACSPTATTTPSSSTSESVQSISPQGAQKRSREPSAGDLQNIISQQFQENSDGERVIGVAELLELRNALRKHHGFADEPPAKSPRIERMLNGNQPGSQCPPMLASVGLQVKAANAQSGIDKAMSGQAAVIGNVTPPRVQHLQFSAATSNSSQSNFIQQSQTKPTEGPHAEYRAGPANPSNTAQQWVAEALQLYPGPARTSQQSESASNNLQQGATPQTNTSLAAATVASSNRSMPPLAPLPKPSNTGRPVQRSGRKQKNPHRRPTVEDTVIIKSEPLSPGYENEEAMCLDPVQDSMNSIVTEIDSISAEQRQAASGPISELQTLCIRLSSSRTPIIPPQSIQSAPSIQSHLTQAVSSPVVHQGIPSVRPSPSSEGQEMRPSLMQDTRNQQPATQGTQRLHNSAVPSQETVPLPLTVQPQSPVELEPTSSGLSESAPSPDTSSAAKVDKEADYTRRLSFLEREMGIIKSWVWEIRTMLTSRNSGIRKGLPKCTDIGEGIVLVGSGEYTITMARVDYLDCWDKTENAKDLVVKLISKVFTEEELASSNYNGGMIRSTHKKRLADEPRFNAILAQAEKEYGVGNLEDRKAIREAVNNKCRKKAFKFRQQEAITQRINQQYQMYKE